jgi:hypothetical protein
MAIPHTEETFQDGNLALATGSGGPELLIVGPSTGAVAGTLYSFSDPDQPFDECGQGNALELAAFLLEAVGGRVFYTCPTLVAASAITLAQPSGTPPAVAATGAPSGLVDLIVQIVTGGILGTATFRYSIDGEDTWSPVYATVASFTGLVARLNITITFAAGTYVAADEYTGSSAGPTYLAASFATAIDLVKDAPYDFRLVVTEGLVTDSTDTLKVTALATWIAAIQTKLASLATTDKIFLRAIVEGPDVADDATADGLLVAGLASTTASRVCVVADFCEIRSPQDGAILKRPAAWALLARILGARGGISEDPGEVGENFEGALPTSVRSLRRDESIRQTLNDGRIATLRTHRRAPGFYVTKAKTLAAAGSDVELLQHAMVIDAGLDIASLEAVKLLNKRQRVNADGTIHEVDARVIEQKIATALTNGLLNEGHITGVTVTVVRDWNVLSSKKLKIKIALQPFGYPETIATTLGFAAVVARAA